MSTMLEEPPAEEVSSAAGSIADEVNSLGADKIVGEVRKNCFLLYVTVRAWRGQFLVRNAEVKVDGRTVDPKMTTGSRWKLIPEKWHKAIQPFESRARAAVTRVGVPFKDGVYVVPKTRAKALVEEIKSIRLQLKSKVEEFEVEWPAIVRVLQDKITADLGPDQWLAVAKVLPDARKLSKLYDIEVGLWPTGGGGLPVECLAELDALSDRISHLSMLSDRCHEQMTGDDANLLDDVVSHIRRMRETVDRSSGKLIEENAEAWMGEAREATNRMVAQAVRAMIEEPVREFTEAVDSLAATAERRTARNESLEVVRRAFQKLQGFQFLMPEEIIDRLKRVELSVGTVDARDMNGGSVAGASVARELRAIRDDLNAESAVDDAFGRFARSIEL